MPRPFRLRRPSRVCACAGICSAARCFVTALPPPAATARCRAQDPTGNLSGTWSCAALTMHPSAKPGSVVLLTDVSILHIRPGAAYACVVPASVTEVYPLDPSPNTQRLLQAAAPQAIATARAAATGQLLQLTDAAHTPAASALAPSLCTTASVSRLAQTAYGDAAAGPPFPHELSATVSVGCVAAAPAATASVGCAAAAPAAGPRAQSCLSEPSSIGLTRLFAGEDDVSVDLDLDDGDSGGNGGGRGEGSSALARGSDGSVPIQQLGHSRFLAQRAAPIPAEACEPQPTQAVARSGAAQPLPTSAALGPGAVDGAAARTAQTFDLRQRTVGRPVDGGRLALQLSRPCNRRGRGVRRWNSSWRIGTGQELYSRAMRRPSLPHAASSSLARLLPHGRRGSTRHRSRRTVGEKRSGLHKVQSAECASLYVNSIWERSRVCNPSKSAGHCWSISRYNGSGNRKRRIRCHCMFAPRLRPVCAR